MSSSGVDDDGVADGGSTDRVITLTDGVVAIAMTLLALDLKPDLPGNASSGDLWRYLGDHAAQYRSFLIAFLVAVMFWRIHHRIMSAVTRTSPGLLSANVLFLLAITVLPLTTYMQGAYAVSLSTTLFAVNILGMSVSTHLLVEVSQAGGLRVRPLTRDELIASRVRLATLVAINALVAALSWVIGENATYFFFLFFVADWPARWVRHRRS